MEKALILNIQRYSIHDGGGIRTLIFFKGCPLRCPWCSNPESQSFSPELMRRESLCIQCSSVSCRSCEKDPSFCPTMALEQAGKEYTIEELIYEIKKDILFYDCTEGGVTLSGGEPLCQGKFAIALLKQLEYLGIDTAIETSGFCSWDILDRVSDHLDRVLFDLKIMCPEKASRILHGDRNIILDNFKRLVHKGIHVIPRIPLIPGYTMDIENIEEIIMFTKDLAVKEVHLLPFHQYGSTKYKSIGKAYALEDLSPPSPEDLHRIKICFEQAGFKVIVGGL
ncbi:glycyl-radical enzyme activating protein [Geosporobacter ferrireducens]|uniref:[formate-C-acetyltransferase]-activating enzyme n=1 Tax=Geosporobacter ferrireducens TaxID=1424294 RepID=A0A1D8GD97_9FIRM|nr:glycyl-radical enzyme activating protein [Geosporobacter ferrireducens]AOT68881.1 [formate-C-acetyltransferase]-activating enzyme [Geosporobacter ferrireducens]MTI54885.1 glycyl-radical enzyme activating protein [Geosporobacter ferrireducens]